MKMTSPSLMISVWMCVSPRDNAHLIKETLFKNGSLAAMPPGQHKQELTHSVFHPTVSQMEHLIGVIITTKYLTVVGIVFQRFLHIVKSGL